ncbi:MAG: hypothetical protein LBC86_03135, partial [Oscillospiraceae bacterium]|nr:hypothetical protein [Oscillospiraceae bacterium]
MSSIKGSSLRIGGLNSGLDTEAIVNAMSASTKLRITTNQRQVLRLEAQQTAYRSIIDKFNGFRDKYFDRLNNNTFLRSRATFNRHMATITQNGAKVTPAGVSVRANANATAGTYNVEVVSHATQAKITSASMDSLNPDFDLSQYEDGQARAMSVTVGGTTRWISFSGDTDADVRTSINHALAKAFGSANNTGTFDSNGNFVPGSGTGIGRVFLNADGKFESTDKAAISTGAIAELNDTVDLGALSGWETGNNSITLVIDGQARTVNFQTVAANYFNDLGFVQNNDGTWTVVGGSQESINAFNAIVTEMYNKQRSDAFDAWLDSVNHNENFRSVVLTQAQRRTALEDAGFDFTGVTDIDAHIDALTSNDNTNIAQRDAARNALTNALDAESLRIRVSALQGWAGDEGIDTTGVNWTNAASVNSFINANEGASAIANNATFNHIYNNQMTDQQKALFDEEVARRNAATRQTEFDRAVSELYNSFDTWQRSIIGASIVPNPDFNPMLPPSAANPATIQNPDYLFMDQWRTMMGLNDIDVEALYTTHGDDWAENILNITESNIPFLAQLTAGTGPFAEMTAAEREELLETWDDLKDAAEERLNGAATTAYNGKIYEHHRLGFLQTGYSERTAFFNSYADGTAIPGNSYNDFFQQQVVGIPGTADAFTAADRAAALVAAGFAGAAGLTTDAEIDAFLASSAMNHSDLSRLHAALLTQRTNAVNNGAGAYNGAENLGRGLTTYERIAILQAQGINTSGITNATNHGDITDFINSSALTDAQRTAVENAMVAARNNKIQAVNLSPEQTIAALAAAGINTSGITDPTDIDEINDFISENVTAQTDRQKANAAIDEARREHFDDLPKTPNPTMTPEALARFFNDSSIEEILNNVTFADGTKIEANVTGGNLILTAYREDADGNRLPAPVPMGFITNEGSDNSFGGPTQGTTVSSVSQSTRLGELGLKDDEGNNITNFTFSVNGVNFSFDANTTIRDMMGSVNNNTSANVQMTFS